MVARMLPPGGRRLARPPPIEPLSLLPVPCSDFAEATRRRLEEAARRKEEEEREKAAQRYQRTEYRTGRLTGGQYTDRARTETCADLAGSCALLGCGLLPAARSAQYA